MNIKNKNAEKFTLAEGIESKILGYGGNMMVVENSFEEGAIAPIHNHIHEQTAYIVKGKFEFTINEEKIIFEQGDSFYVGPNVSHGCVCLEKGIVVDNFSPIREDFLEKVKK
ncbi:MAG: cupin domain-containing protein [Clostridiales bacterium]|nr:cupin domain-containing protein [Clostridiales bacterium]